MCLRRYRICVLQKLSEWKILVRQKEDSLKEREVAPLLKSHLTLRSKSFSICYSHPGEIFFCVQY